MAPQLLFALCKHEKSFFHDQHYVCVDVTTATVGTWDTAIGPVQYKGIEDGLETNHFGAILPGFPSSDK